MKKYDEAESVKKQNKLKHELKKAMKQITELKKVNVCIQNACFSCL